MEISTVFWSDDPCSACGKDVREITLIEVIDGEPVSTVLLECSDDGCTTRAWAYVPALAA